MFVSTLLLASLAYFGLLGVYGASSRTQQCSFSVQIPSPCRCYHKSLYCRGSQVDDAFLGKLFRNLSSQIPKYLRKIDSFKLRDSKVKSISSKVFGDISVRSYILLRNNQLTDFAIGNFDHLYMLDVSSNEISKLKLDSFIGLEQLRVLHAANIGLTTLKKEYFSHLKNLQRLDLSGNGIELVEIDAFTSEYDNNFALRDIDLSFNKIRRLPENIFLVLRQPERINLANNRLQDVRQVFRFNRDIVQFDPTEIVLSNNSLSNEHFSNGIFDDIVARGHHVKLDLTHNKLVWLNQAIFGKLLHRESRSVLLLDNNPIQCTNCRNRWLFEKANLLNAIVLQTCIEQKRLSDFSIADFAHCRQT